MTAADLSVTDNARAGQCPDHKPVQHRDGKPPWCNRCGLTAAGTTPPEPAWAAARAETTTAHECDSGDFDRTICGCGAMHSYCTGCGTRQDDCRAETTTATTEDAARVIDDACYGGASSPQEIAQALADAGLLATARTESIPHRDELAQAVMEATVPFRGPGGQTAPCVMPVHYAIADAVLALLGGETP